MFPNILSSTPYWDRLLWDTFLALFGIFSSLNRMPSTLSKKQDWLDLKIIMNIFLISFNSESVNHSSKNWEVLARRKYMDYDTNRISQVSGIFWSGQDIPIFWHWTLVIQSGVRLLDGHFIQIPHGAVYRRRPSGRSTPIYYSHIYQTQSFSLRFSSSVLLLFAPRSIHSRLSLVVVLKIKVQFKFQLSEIKIPIWYSLYII